MGDFVFILNYRDVRWEMREHNQTEIDLDAPQTRKSTTQLKCAPAGTPIKRYTTPALT